MIHHHLKQRQFLPFVPAVKPGRDTPTPLAHSSVATRPPASAPRKHTPAVFLDRDGTLIEDCGSLQSPAQAVFYSDTVAALRKLQVHYQLFIVTNQSGVAKRELTLHQVNEVNDFVVSWLQLHDVSITAVYCCPHQRTDGCSCIKPNPHFLYQAARDHNVDLHRSFVVGDHPHDVELARNAGARGIYVLTGHGQKHRAKLDGSEVVVPGIAAAADWILERPMAASAANRRSLPQEPAGGVRSRVR